MMNCQTVRRYLYAFADGELAVRENCEVLDHLKMCPDCTRLVDEQHTLRSTLRRNLESETAPAPLVARVEHMLDHRRAPTGIDYGVWFRRLVPLAAAAAIGLATFTVWRTVYPASATPFNSTKHVERGDTAATLVVLVHEHCCENAAAHQNPDLPRKRIALASAISDQFGGRIRALAPDMSPYGYAFESANICQVRPRLPAGHLIYVNETDEQRLSFFSTPRWGCLDRCNVLRSKNEDELRQFEVEQEQQIYAVVAWHDEQTTYLLCAPMRADDLIKIARPIRLALRTSSDAYASLWPALSTP
jgi:hypothetical protein